MAQSGFVSPVSEGTRLLDSAFEHQFPSLSRRLFRLMFVAGARPNLMKIAPLFRAFAAHLDIASALTTDDSIVWVWHQHQGVRKSGKVPRLWDGKATDRCLEAIIRALDPRPSTGFRLGER
jgi:hypothetical protein